MIKETIGLALMRINKAHYQRKIKEVSTDLYNQYKKTGHTAHTKTNCTILIREMISSWTNN